MSWLFVLQCRFDERNPFDSLLGLNLCGFIIELFNQNGHTHAYRVC